MLTINEKPSKLDTRGFFEHSLKQKEILRKNKISKGTLALFGLDISYLAPHATQETKALLSFVAKVATDF